MTRVVLDTNIFVSAVLGRRLTLILYWRSGRFTLVVTNAIVESRWSVHIDPSSLCDESCQDVVIVLSILELFQEAKRLALHGLSSLQWLPRDDEAVDVAATRSRRHPSIMMTRLDIPV